MMKQIRISNVAPNSFKLKQKRKPTTKTTTITTAAQRERDSIFTFLIELPSVLHLVGFTAKYIFTMKQYPTVKLWLRKVYFMLFCHYIMLFFSVKVHIHCPNEKRKKKERKKSKTIKENKMNINVQNIDEIFNDGL